MLVTSANIASLDALLQWWERAEYIAEGFVILGCVGEFTAEFTNVNKQKWGHQLSKASLLILIVALAIGLGALVRTNSLSGKEIVLLNGVADAEHLARLKIEQDVANRDITPDDQKKLSLRLSVFAGQKADIDVFPVTIEHVSIAQTISGILINAHWKQPSVNMLPVPANRILTSNGTGAPAPFMVQGIWISATGDTRSQSAAVALFEALKDTAAPGMDHVPLPNPEDPRVWIYVGDKPTTLRSWVK